MYLGHKMVSSTGTSPRRQELHRCNRHVECWLYLRRFDISFSSVCYVWPGDVSLNHDNVQYVRTPLSASFVSRPWLCGYVAYDREQARVSQYASNGEGVWLKEQMRRSVCIGNALALSAETNERKRKKSRWNGIWAEYGSLWDTSSEVFELAPTQQGLFDGVHVRQMPWISGRMG